MKKTLLIVGLVVLALGALSVGVVAAQGGQPPSGQRGVVDGVMGPMHEYMEQAMADAVGLDLEEFEARHDSGETFYQIALDEGFTAEEIPALMQDARTKGLEAAVTAGVISQEQADWMGSRGIGRGGMMNGYGYGNGGCPMYDGDEAPQGQYNRGPGFGGRGMMGNWGGQY